MIHTPEEQEQRDRHSSIQFPSNAEKRNFWAEYPSNAWDFKRLVLEGIFYKIDPTKLNLPKHPDFHPRESYGGIPLVKFLRIYRYWEASPRNFAKQHSPAIFKAFGEYRDDLRRWESETKLDRMRKKEILKEARRLPTPPVGFYWYEMEYNRFESVETYLLWIVGTDRATDQQFKALTQPADSDRFIDDAAPYTPSSRRGWRDDEETG